MCRRVGEFEPDVFASALEEALGCGVEKDSASNVTGVSGVGGNMSVTTMNKWYEQNESNALAYKETQQWERTRLSN